MKLEYKVSDNKYFNVRDVLKSQFNISERLLTKLKKSNSIFLNNENTFLDKTVKINDIITVEFDFNEETDNIVPKEALLNILYEDDSLLIVNKPSSMPVHPSMNHYEDSLSNIVKYYYNKNHINKKIRPVNRLDKDTSGIVIFAKNEYIQECLIKQMKNYTFQKEYLAILEDYLKDDFGTINAPISRKEGSIIEREINQNGDISITHFKVSDRFIVNNQMLSLVEFKLETGRTHQIRVHSKYIHHPIIGDTLYGNTSSLISRQALHAYKIKIIHPITNKELIINASLPEDMLNIINKKETAI